MQHFFHPRHVGHGLAEPCSVGLAGSVQKGVFMRMFVRVSDGRVEDACYGTYGCVPAIAAGSLLIDHVIGRPLEEALAFSGADLTDALGGLPPDRRFCADLAVDALRAAIYAALERTSKEGAAI